MVETLEAPAPRKRRKSLRRSNANRVSTTDAQHFGARLKRLRLTHGHTLRDAASAAGVPSASWQHYERGSRTPRPWRVAELARGLGLPVAALLTDDLVLAEVRVSPETIAEVKRGGMPAAELAAQRIASALAPLLYAEATRKPVDLSPGSRPKRRRTRAEVLEGIAAANAARAARDAKQAREIV